MINWVASHGYLTVCLILLIIALGSSIYMFNDKKTDAKKRHRYAYMQLICAVAIVLILFDTPLTTWLGIMALLASWVLGYVERHREKKVVNARVKHLRLVRRVLDADPSLKHRFDTKIRQGINKQSSKHGLFTVDLGDVGDEINRRIKALKRSRQNKD